MILPLCSRQLRHFHLRSHASIIKSVSSPLKVLQIASDQTACRECLCRSFTTSRPNALKRHTVRLMGPSKGPKQTSNSTSSSPNSSSSKPPITAPKKDLAKVAAVSSQIEAKPPEKSSLEVRPEDPPKPKRTKIDFSKTYTENIYITPVRAMLEFYIEPGDLADLPKKKRRSPYRGEVDITVYLRKDVEKKAIEKWGSLDHIQKMKMEHIHARTKMRLDPNMKEHGEELEEEPFVYNPIKNIKEHKATIFRSGSGQVVLLAIGVNGFNTTMKFAAWYYTQSHSMFAEFIHSIADTANQCVLAYGLYKSLDSPDTVHPYGWASIRNISSLISGVGIFFLGAGLSVYHGISGLLHGSELVSPFWAFGVLGGALVSEGCTLALAINQVIRSAKMEKMSALNYVLHTRDPSTNVVLLEDFVAVLGILVAGSCLGMTYAGVSTLADPVGSITIGLLLAGVASFIIYTNSMALVGKSIPSNKRLLMVNLLESDRMIRAVHDVKATDMGGSYIRFKAEVDVDGREITRSYLQHTDIEKLFDEVKLCRTSEDVENLMLRHGENIVDTIGGEVDRIERKLKKTHPEIRHVDLELN